MMKKIFLYLFIFLAFQAIAQETNILQLKDVDGIKYFHNAPFTGKAYTYSGDGSKTSESNFMDGKLSGIQTSWYKNGKIYSTAEFKDGKFNGLMTYYYENGQIKSQEIYVNDFRNGLAVYFYENGQKESEGHYFDCFNGENPI